MMRTLFGVGIVLALVLAGITYYFTAEMEKVNEEIYQNLQSNSFDESITQRKDALGHAASWISLFIIVFFDVLHVLTLRKLKTRTMKMLNIPAMVLTTVMLGFSIMMVAFPGTAEFDALNIAWYVYAVLMLGYSVIGLMQARMKA